MVRPPASTGPSLTAVPLQEGIPGALEPWKHRLDWGPCTCCKSWFPNHDDHVRHSKSLVLLGGGPPTEWVPARAQRGLKTNHRRQLRHGSSAPESPQSSSQLVQVEYPSSSTNAFKGFRLLVCLLRPFVCSPALPLCLLQLLQALLWWIGLLRDAAIAASPTVSSPRQLSPPVLPFAAAFCAYRPNPETKPLLQ